MSKMNVIDRSFLVVRGSDRMGPYSRGELGSLIDDGVLLPEDSCYPESHASRVRSVAWWLAQGESEDLGRQKTDEDFGSVGESSIYRREEDPLSDGRIALGGDTPVSRSDPPEPVDDRANERTLYRGRPTILAYGKSLGIIGFLGLASLFLGMFGDIYVVAALTLLALALFVLAIDRYACLYLVSNRRVELVEGLVAKSSREVLIRDIRAINVSRNGVLGMLGVGTVEFDSAAGNDKVEVSFANVARASKVKHLVRKLQEEL